MNEAANWTQMIMRIDGQQYPLMSHVRAIILLWCIPFVGK